MGLNGYNQRLFEDSNVNKMHESLKLFKQASIGIMSGQGQRELLRQEIGNVDVKSASPKSALSWVKVTVFPSVTTKRGTKVSCGSKQKRKTSAMTGTTTVQASTNQLDNTEITATNVLLCARRQNAAMLSAVGMYVAYVVACLVFWALSPGQHYRWLLISSTTVAHRYHTSCQRPLWSLKFADQHM